MNIWKRYSMRVSKNWVKFNKMFTLSPWGPEQQRRLRGLQFRIDCQRRLARNNLDSCIRIANMMHESVHAMRRHIVHLQEASQEESEEIVPPNNVIWLVERVKDK